VGGITANTHVLKESIWSVLSRNDVTVGMAKVPATFPVMPVNGYMSSGMPTRGKNGEDGVLCAPKIVGCKGRGRRVSEDLATAVAEKRR